MPWQMTFVSLLTRMLMGGKGREIGGGGQGEGGRGIGCRCENVVLRTTANRRSAARAQADRRSDRRMSAARAWGARAAKELRFHDVGPDRRAGQAAASSAPEA